MFCLSSLQGPPRAALDRVPTPRACKVFAVDPVPQISPRFTVVGRSQRAPQPKTLTYSGKQMSQLPRAPISIVPRDICDVNTNVELEWIHERPRSRASLVHLPSNTTPCYCCPSLGSDTQRVSPSLPLRLIFSASHPRPENTLRHSLGQAMVLQWPYAEYPEGVRGELCVQTHGILCSENLSCLQVRDMLV